LSKTIFPLGNYTKDQVRIIAKKNKLANWSKKDSTGICFIGERDFKPFLSNYISYKKGKVVDISTNQQIGTHDGIYFFTLGQNKGLGLSGQSKKYFVCQKDMKKNILYVCDEQHKKRYLSSKLCELEAFNWINGVAKNNKVKIRFRHRQKFVKGQFKIIGKKVCLMYSPTIAVTPGQFAVLYQGKICLGGGIVNKLI
jgi:tRNA-specific 2-thiouridylase